MTRSESSVFISKRERDVILSKRERERDVIVCEREKERENYVMLSREKEFVCERGKCV